MSARRPQHDHRDLPLDDAASNCGCSLQQTYEAKRQEFLVELQKREDEMRQMFVQRVKEKEAELKDAEREVSGPSVVFRNVFRLLMRNSFVEPLKVF